MINFSGLLEDIVYKSKSEQESERESYCRKAAFSASKQGQFVVKFWLWGPAHCFDSEQESESVGYKGVDKTGPETS